MGVYIKGMEMPTKENVFVLIAPSGDVWMVKDTPDEDTYLVNTKAISVSDHGRLIDADEADDYAYDELEISNSYLSPREASRNMQLIYKNMPTIIPAEEGEI